MTVQELIDELNQVEDKTKRVAIKDEHRDYDFDLIIDEFPDFIVIF